MRVALLGLFCLLVACAPRDASYATACEENGLIPGTLQYQKCVAAKVKRQDAGARSAVDTVRSVDVIGTFK
jgi:hypothetical protein